MPRNPVPYSMRPKATKLPAGPDETLDPAAPPTDPAARSLPAYQGARVDASAGPGGPPDAPLAPPPTDPATRGLAPFEWPTGPGVEIPNRPLRELVSPIPDLDPDIALWPVTIVQRWPFSGHPAVGQWPRGWIGVDNTSTLWVCTAAGEPGTWAVLASTGGSGWPAIDGTGPGNLNAEITNAADAVGYNFTNLGTGPFQVLQESTGGIWLQTGTASEAGVHIEDDGSAGVLLLGGSSGTGPIKLWQQGTGGIELLCSGSNITIDPGGSTGQVEIIIPASGAVVITSLPTADPALAGALWNSNGIVHTSTGNPTEAAGHLATTYNTTTSLATFLSTSSLTAGKWRVTLNAQVNISAGDNIQIVGGLGTATGTLEGTLSAEIAPGSGSFDGQVTLTFVVNVTAPGTIAFQAQGTGGSTVDATGTVYAGANATGWTAVQVP